VYDCVPQYSVTWRAGSGDGTEAGRNECSPNRGWLPAGWYAVRGHWPNYNGTKVKGRVWYLSDKVCWNGTKRTELFIHTEETADNLQTCGQPYYDERFCWEGTMDYLSQGCIKVAYPRLGFPDDIGSVHWYWHNRGGGSDGSCTLYSKLYVHGG
jgi:hypothetical protein